uniref:Uncharacterized protein n=1 Tax=Monodon monoceros TaxID=40151 RepID=A0A8C6BH38_MONMO
LVAPQHVRSSRTRDQTHVPCIGSSRLFISFPFCPQKIGAYSVSKMALLGLTQTLAVELASKNIWVNFLVPGIINTDCRPNSVELFGKIPRNTEVCCDEAVSIRIWINWPEDCAELVSFLCSSDASYITALRLYFTYFFVHISCFSIKC